MLPQSRISMIGETPHAHEREGIEFACANIPDREPFHLWGLLELLDASSGRLHEIDLLVLGYSALYLIEIKSGPGVYEGDSVDWYRRPPDQVGPGTRGHYMDPPLKLANFKAKVLKSRLQAKMKHPDLAPRVEALVFLSHPDTTLKLSEDGKVRVITRSGFARAVTHHDFPGAPADWRGRPISAPVAADIAQALKAIGVRKRKGQMHVGSYELGAVLQEGSGYQDREATHRTNERIKARARTYLVPSQTSVERRQQLLRAADREASLLYDVREHPNVLTYTDFVTDAPVGPTVLLEAFEGSEPLGAFLRKRPELPFQARVDLILQVGRALAHCHRKGVVHGALSPEAILVRESVDLSRGEGGQLTLESRLFSFQLGHGSSVESTRHRSALTDEPVSLYQAPELRLGNESATPSSDIYGLGAIAYLVFTGRAPGETLLEIDAQLTQQGCLDPALRSDSTDPKVAEWIRCTTHVVPIERDTDIHAWLELLEHEARKVSAEPREETVDPLHAVKEDLLDDGFQVEGVLGHGATARVLQVMSNRHKGSLALKVSAGEEHHDRLRREGELLAQLRHQHIVPHYETLTLSGRTCLLLGLAGETTLDRHLAEEGTVSLEYASRYGEDLLSALNELEEKSVLHRDIKPANVGVRSVGKSAHHLTLFDFSLAGVPVTDIRVGTAPYRDPYLPLRGAWDHAGDRWSAAITLHEMLTAVRPAFGADHDPTDLTARVVVSPERFDASVREPLTAFFAQALHPDFSQRFSSADAMRRAWLRAFDAPLLVKPVSTVTPAPVATGDHADNSSTEDPDPDPSAVQALNDEALAQIAPHALISSLPLSPRAKNALDRKGLNVAGDLLRLPDNQLSLIRGVGSKVAKEILEFRRRWKDAANLSLSIPADPMPFVPARASTPGEPPGTLEAWVELLYGGSKKREQHLRALLGLEAPFAGRLDVSASEVTKHFGLQAAASIYISHRKCRDAWAELPPATLAPLVELCSALIGEGAGVLRQDEAAAALLSRLPHEGSTASESLQQAQAVALFRAVADLEQDRVANAQSAQPNPPALHFVRLRVGFFVVDPSLKAALETLGMCADAFAQRPIIAAPSEVTRALVALTDGTQLAGATQSRLTALAALASSNAARSTALELYPRGMEARRALDLSAAALVGQLNAGDVQRRVQGRYPEAELLPARPELDGLLQVHGLLWNEASQRYERRAAASSTSQATAFTTTSGGHSVTRVRGADSAPIDSAQQLRFDERPREGVLKGPEADQVAIRDFEDALRESLDRRQLRVLSVSADEYLADATRALGRRLHAKPCVLDRELTAEMRRVLQDEGAEIEPLYAIDREERAAGEDWFELTKLAREAADHWAARILPPSAPLLLCQPGLIARFGLDNFIKHLVAASELEASAAIFLLVPVTGMPPGLPTINGYRIPHMNPWQRLWVPRAWVKRQLAVAHAEGSRL